ncbi:gliding motility-associated C-terminal domain-containing protein [Zunongwangia sp. F363]|uniref:Gliding motility-associated C-terminal domain-containing protein n=1 Tax=Autumnicola tepida TaxID=3075595 RepID=A0ABU3CEM5_9FLAO|nr:gliding motility-associated C-terminal domain-containing protein [Zunongwangia sp. F363]MDT0644799.1 gliding motility-associated C-terminal domain-containing protein [Zunongwangia sp. F363]
MQNFTLGRKGKIFSFFAFILLIGTFPSFGQTGNCPTVGDDDASTGGNQQSFCYLSTVADLDGTAASGTTLRWYRSETATTPIPSTELLQDGTYYAGNADGSCTTRPSVTVDVDDYGAPEPSFGVVFSPCMYSTTGANTVAELIELVDGNDVEVYTEEFSGSPLAPGTNLTPETSYYVGQRNPETDCPTSRVAVRYDPIAVQPPSGEAEQVFCDGATVADLQASGTNRWYSTEDSFPALDPSTPLVDGESYFATQIINRVNSPEPPCESIARLQVNVTILDAGEDNTDNTLCVSEADSQLNTVTNARAYFEGLLEDGVPTGGSFSPSLQSIVDGYANNPVGTYQTSYTATFDIGCTDTVLLGVNVQEDPNAGQDTDVTICESDIQPLLALENLPVPVLITAAEEYFKDFIDDSGIDDSGEFSPSIEEVYNSIIADAENNAFPQTYTVTYTVDNEGCVASSTLNLTIEDAANAGSTVADPIELCETQVEDQGIFNSEDSLAGFFIDRLGAEDTDGTFSPALGTLITNYNDGIDGASEDFTTTYTVERTNCDNASATITLTINAAPAADAGTITSPEPYCSNDGVIILANLLDSSSIPGGTFSSDDADVANGTFNPSTEGAGEHVIIYTVSEENPELCVTGTDTAEFIITVNDTPNAGPGGDFNFCVSQLEDIFSSPDAQQALLNEFGGSYDAGGEFTPSLPALAAQFAATTAFPATFNVEYSVTNENCDDSAAYQITVTETREANAGSDVDDITYCTTDAEVDLFSLLSDDADAIGTFEGYDGGTFDPSVVGAGTYTFNYNVLGDGECITGSDSAVITIEVFESPDAGTTVNEVVCISDVENISTTEDAVAFFSAYLDGNADMDGTFEPTLETLAAQLLANPVGTFETIYTVANDNCSASSSLSITVRDEIEADLTEVANPAPICQNAGIQDLTDFIGDNPDFGVFEGYENGTLDPGVLTAGDYEITYSLDESTTECVTGSASITFTISIVNSALAGFDEEVTICTNDEITDLYSYVADFADMDGTFTYNGEELEDGMFDPAMYTPGTYQVVYTVPSENDCGEDTATYTITLSQSPDAGMDGTMEVCQNAEMQDLYNLLAEDIATTGEFSLDGEVIEEGMMDPSAFDAGTYDVLYTISNENCSDSAIFAVTVLDAANAGEDMEVTYCMNDGAQMLFDEISVDADADGTFTLDGETLADGIFDPAAYEAAEYEIIYTVESTTDCEDSSATITVTVAETPAAPTVTDMTFCASEGATVANLDAQGTNLVYYADIELSQPLAMDEPLANNTPYYVTQIADEGGCVSEAAVIMVAINDAPTPTINEDELELCEYYDNTIEDLSAAINETGDVTWYASAEGTDVLSENTPLEDGVTYFATLTDATTGCESSQRLSYTVALEECALVFPEGISPNGDGRNDTFYVDNIEFDYPNHTIQIFNRWGNTVYKGKASEDNAWDGTSNQSGSLGDGVLPVGVYFYVIDFNDGVTPPQQGKIYLSL